MGNYVNRDDLSRYQKAVSTKGKTDPPWLEVQPGSPNDNLLQSQPYYYLKLESGSNTIEELTPIEKQSVDAEREQADLDDKRGLAISAVDTTDAAIGWENRGHVANYNQRDNYHTNRYGELQATLLAIKATTGGADTIRDAIPDTFLPTATRERDEAITAYRDFVAIGAADDPAPPGAGRGVGPDDGPPGGPP